MSSWIRIGRRVLARPVAIVAVLIVLVSANLVRADGAETAPGSLSGVVSTRGTGLPGVVVSAVPTASGSAALVVSGEHGVFRIAGLAPGSYDLVAELEGFRPTTLAGVMLSAGESRRVDIELDVAVFGMLKRYAEFIQSSQEHIVTHALLTVFTRDQEFHTWLAATYPEEPRDPLTRRARR